jgi:hypothetical protein
MVINDRDGDMMHWYTKAKDKLVLGKKDAGLRDLFALWYHLHHMQEPSQGGQLTQRVDNLCRMWGSGFDWD